MRKGLLIFAAFVLVFLFAGGMIALLGAQDGNPSADPEQGMPAARDATLDPAPEQAADLGIEQSLRTPGGLHYALSKTRGFLVSFDEGRTWIERNQGLSRRVVYPFTDQRVRQLTSLAVDPVREARVAVTMASELFLSENFGSTWEPVPIGKPLRSSAYLTSVALSPFSPDTLLLGTSFNGFFESVDRGKNWQDLSISARFLNRGAGFYEEISGLSYDPLAPGVIYFACGFGRGLYRSSADRKTWSRMDFPGDAHGEIIRRLDLLPLPDGGRALEVSTADSRWSLHLGTGEWRLLEKQEKPSPRQDPFLRERLRRAADKYGIYVSSYKARGEDLDRHLKFLKEQGLNSLVVDCKDDFGWVTYDTALELPYGVGAVEKRFRLEELLRKAHDNGIYVIGRVVVFKDMLLYRHENFKYALWNYQTNQPWRYIVKVEAENGGDLPAADYGNEEPKYLQREFWVDPYSPFVWSYNIAIAAELQSRGVDEVQFDYIRFPSDGNLSTIRYRYKREGMDLIDALQSFLILARESIHIPISTDLYGFSTWHRMGNWIGQSIEMLADYVDVISPMFYPSHFPPDFMKEEPYLERARKIYQEGTTRADMIVGGRSLIRPYVQAFLIGGELQMGAAEYFLYLTNQIQGTLAAPSSGFTLWNASNRYYMVTGSLKPFLPAALD